MARKTLPSRGAGASGGRRNGECAGGELSLRPLRDLQRRRDRSCGFPSVRVSEEQSRRLTPVSGPTLSGIFTRSITQGQASGCNRVPCVVRRDEAVRRCGGSSMPTTRPTTAPAARPAARSSPIARCRGCSRRAGRAALTTSTDSRERSQPQCNGSLILNLPLLHQIRNPEDCTG